MISTNSKIVAAKDQIFSDLGGEVAILNLNNGVYYGLDAVGARIWNLIQEPTPVDNIRDALLREYDIDPISCEYELINLLEKMLAEDLVEIR